MTIIYAAHYLFHLFVRMLTNEFIYCLMASTSLQSDNMFVFREEICGTGRGNGGTAVGVSVVDGLSFVVVGVVCHVVELY
jgi:hypothetical protein